MGDDKIIILDAEKNQHPNDEVWIFHLFDCLVMIDWSNIKLTEQGYTHALITYFTPHIILIVHFKADSGWGTGTVDV